MQRVLFVVAVLMLALPRLGVHAPRFEGLEAKVRASASELRQARDAFDAVPHMRTCLESVASDTAADATEDACAAYEDALP